MLWIWGKVKKLFGKRDKQYSSPGVYVEVVNSITPVVYNRPIRGLLRSVDKRVGYRKERSQAKNWKKWKCR